MTGLFVDTSYWIALELSDDQNHQPAQSYWNSLDLARSNLVTTTYVLDETVTFLNSRDAHQNAVSLGENILLSTHIELVHVDEQLFFDAWNSFKKYNDKRFSLTDCISFAVMNDRRINTALSFDSDFRQVGFLCEPQLVS